ncbi:MAG: hypothetical protein ACFE95_22725 [Candidatus Hodarchaeota archaeon]
MASQYITFMIIFTLGLSMVIITNGIFLSLSEQFRTNVADIEMTRILTLIQSQIQRNLLFHTDSTQIIEQEIELPVLLGQGLRYTIELSNSSNSQDIILHGFTINNEINQETTISLGTKYTIVAGGEFHSITPLLTIHIEKNVNYIALTIS